jgi:hypothetical protein
MAGMFEVAHNQDNAVIYADEELLRITDRLPREARICGDTFRPLKKAENSGDVHEARRFTAESSPSSLSERRVRY